MLAAHEIRIEVRAVTVSRRSSSVAIVLLLLALTGAACAPSAGSLGTPAAPVTTPAVSGEPVASDVVPETPPASPSPSPAESLLPPGSTAPASSNAGSSPTAKPAAPPTATPTGTTIVRAYFMLGSFTDNPGLAPVLRTVPETKAVARAAMNALLDGPRGAELKASPAMYTSIPDGTRLLDVSIANSVATVLLSREWIAADATRQGEIASAQVTYTLTQFATVNKVRIQVDGESPRFPVGRSDFQVQGILPAIFVDRPAWGAAAGNPVKLSGLANVFEATFRVQVLDAKGKVLADERVMASCGTGCWGTFKAAVAYDLAKAQYGTLRVFEPSARDGKPVNVTEYRVWLTPAP